MSQSDTGDRRQTPRRLARHEVCLYASLLILDIGAEGVDPRDRSLVLYGTTRDLSDKGLAVTIANVKIDDRFRGEDFVIPLTLFLPNGQVELEMSPVRCDQLDPGQSEEAYLMAGRLSSISDDHRRILLQYLNG